MSGAPTPQESTPFYCPRCNKPKANEAEARAHVARQHPDYDPEWWDTIPYYGD